MPEFMLAYYGGKKPESPEEGAKHMARYQAWLAGLGEAVINPGTPLKKFKMVSSDSVTDDTREDHLSGFTVVKADSIDEAIEMAKTCPFLDMGTMGVAEMMKM